MTDAYEPPVEPEITSDDKLWSAIGYPIPIMPIIVLLSEGKKDNPFLKYHAVQSLIFNVVIWALITVISIVTLGIGAICAPLLWLAVLWPAYGAWQGQYSEIPVVTNFMKGQNWA